MKTAAVIEKPAISSGVSVEDSGQRLAIWRRHRGAERLEVLTILTLGGSSFPDYHDPRCRSYSALIGHDFVVQYLERGRFKHGPVVVA